MRKSFEWDFHRSMLPGSVRTMKMRKDGMSDERVGDEAREAVMMSCRNLRDAVSSVPGGPPTPLTAVPRH